jgi:hypothetical protein
MWESPYPIPCALGELAVDQDRNATDALRQQLTFETNGRPILGIELLIHFLHNSGISRVSAVDITDFLMAGA